MDFGGGRHHDSDDADAHEATQGGTLCSRLALGNASVVQGFSRWFSKNPKSTVGFPKVPR